MDKERSAYLQRAMAATLSGDLHALLQWIVEHEERDFFEHEDAPSAAHPWYQATRILHGREYADQKLREAAARHEREAEPCIICGAAVFHDSGCAAARGRVGR